MQKNMQLYAAVFRTGDTLDEGCNRLQAIYSKLKDIKVKRNFNICLFIIICRII